MSNSLIAAADIGGSHITVAVVDIDNATLIEHTWIRRNVDSNADAQKVLSSWADAFRGSFKKLDILPGSIGVAMPGPFDYETGISLIKDQCKYDALYGLNVKQLLAEELDIEKEKIVFTNDAACFLQGELSGGVAKGFSKVLGLTLGTGLGAARSMNGIAVDANLWCTPFKEGIAEDYLSNRWFLKRYFELSGSEVGNVFQLSEMAMDNPNAAQVFREFGHNLGCFLLPLILEEHIELVVLGGNISRALPLFSQELNAVIQSDKLSVSVQQSLLGENASLVGAASYCQNKTLSMI